jgi:hypothetical protein
MFILSLRNSANDTLFQYLYFLAWLIVVASIKYLKVTGANTNAL